MMSKRSLGARFFVLLTVAALLLILAAVSFGQTETGQITGVVKDSTGAVVPKAKVTVLAVASGMSRSATTNSAGIYSFPALRPTTYKVTVEAAGFVKFEQTVTVNVSAVVDVSPKLTVGSSSTVVEVSGTASAVAVNTENQTMSEVIDSKAIDDLPTSPTRNPYALVQLSGNVTEDTNSNRGAGFSINGQRSSSTSILLDGAENVNTFTASTGQQVPLDSVQEFSVLTNNFGAEYGRASGGVVNLVTKSGTNQFHGSAYEFNRVAALASNSFYNDANKIAKGGFTRNNFGYSIGGPLIKDKLFFFDNWEWLRVRSSATQLAAIIDPGSYPLLGASSQAFFAQYGALSSAKTRLLKTGPCDSAGNPGAILTCDLVSYKESADDGGGVPQNGWDQVARVDWTMSPRNSLTMRYAGYWEEDFKGTLNYSPYTGGSATGAGYDTGQTYHDLNLSLAWNYLVSSNLVNTAKVNYNRLKNVQPLGTAPIQPSLYINPAVSPVPALGQSLQFPGYSPLTPGNSIPFGGPQNLYQFYDDLAYTHGKHQLKVGGQFLQIRDNRTFGAYENAVALLSNADYSSGLSNLISGNLKQYEVAINPQGEYPCERDISTGAYIQTAACTLNLPAFSPSFNRNYKYKDGAAYVQDSWKVTPRLTVNIGLRWEYYGVQHNSNQNLDSNFVMGPGATVFDRIRNGAVELSKDGGVFWKPYYGGFGPHVGFAYDVFGNGKTSLRGGYSIGYERNFGNVTFNAIQNPPAYAVLSLVAPSTIASMPVYTDNFGPVAGSTGSTLLPAVSQRAIDQNLKMAYAETYNLGVEHSLYKDIKLNVSYAGSRGVHLYDISNINGAYDGSTYLGDARASNRLNLQYSAMNFRSDHGYSYYNALLLGVKGNNVARTGVSLSVNYTWSHALDNLSSTFTETFNGVSGAYQLGYLDAFNPKLNYGNSDYDIRHRFIVSYSWELPWAKNSTNPLMKYAVAGWLIGGSFNLRSGMPYSIYDSTNEINTSAPLYAPNVKFSKSGHSHYTGGGYYTYVALPTSAGTIADIGNSNEVPTCTGLYHVGCTYTNDGSPYPERNQFFGPSFFDADMTFLKNFKITERVQAQLRSELYNVFNHHNLYVYGYNLDVAGINPNSPYIQADKGGIYGQPGQPTDETRRIQFGLRVSF
jgi:outer membrane receptor protein involved in Fe transport